MRLLDVTWRRRVSRQALTVAVLSLGACTHMTSDVVHETAEASDPAPVEARRAIVAGLEPQREPWLAQLRDVTPESEWPNSAADGIVALAIAHAALGDFDDAALLFERYERATLSARLPAIIRTTATLYRAHVEHDRGSYGEGSALAGSVCDEAPEDEYHADQVIGACWMVAVIGAEAGDGAVLTRLPMLPEDDPAYASRARMRAYVLAKLDRADEAEAAMRRVLPRFDLTSLEGSGDHRTFGLIQFARGRFELAFEAHRREYEMDLRSAQSMGEPLRALTESDDVALLARAGLAAGRRSIVCPQVAASLDRLRREHGDRHPAVGILHVRMAQCSLDAGQDQAARADVRRAVRAFATCASSHVGARQARELAAVLGIR